MDVIENEFEPREEDIRHLREWIVKTPHLVHDYEDHLLKVLIVACKGSMQKAKESLEKYNRLGFTHPHMFGHLDPSSEFTQYYLSNVYIFPMPERTDDDCTIIIATAKLTEVDSTKFNVFELARFILMSYMVLAWENNLGSSKFIVIYDSGKTRLSKLKLVTPKFLKDCVSLGLSFPVRVKGGHLVNVPHYLQPILTFVQSLLPKKLSDRIHFHSSMDELHQFIPKKCLPNEFGGVAGDLDALFILWKKKVESYGDRLILENDKMRKLDHLRPKPNDSMPSQGSFRKLDVD